MENKEYRRNIKVFIAPNRYWKTLVLVSGDVWHSFEIDFPFNFPNEKPLLGIA